MVSIRVFPKHPYLCPSAQEPPQTRRWRQTAVAADGGITFGVPLLGHIAVHVGLKVNGPDISAATFIPYGDIKGSINLLGYGGSFGWAWCKQHRPQAVTSLRAGFPGLPGVSATAGSQHPLYGQKLRLSLAGVGGVAITERGIRLSGRVPTVGFSPAAGLLVECPKMGQINRRVFDRPLYQRLAQRLNQLTRRKPSCPNEKPG